MNDLIKRSARLTAILTITAAAVLISIHKTSWAFGLLIGATWSVINFLLIVGILKISILQKPDARLSAILLLKFPVLYLAGFLILNSRAFPVSSLLAGLVSIVLVMGVYTLWPKRV